MNNKIYYLDSIDDEGMVSREFFINLRIKKIDLYVRSIISRDYDGTIGISHTTELIDDNDNCILLNDYFINIVIKLEDMYSFDIEDEDTLEGNLVDIENYLLYDGTYNLKSISISISKEQSELSPLCIGLSLTKTIMNAVIHYLNIGVGELEFFNSYIEYE